MMLLFPKNTKWKKSFSRKSRSFSENKTLNLLLGNFSLISLESGKINNKQLEGVRRTLRRILKKQGKSWLRPFPNSSITKKPDETRMGKGKGNHKAWICIINKGETIVEIKGCHWKQAKDALLQAKRKLSLNTYICLDKNFLH